MKGKTQTSSIPNRKQSSGILLTVLAIWHVLLALGCLAGAVVLWQRYTPEATWLQWLYIIVIVLIAASSAITVPLILRREHRGRILSLAINYLGFLICLFGSMHALGIFVGIDSLASSFGRGILFLAGVLSGYLITTIGDRYENHPGRERFFRRLGKIIMAIFGILFLFAVGILPGIISLLSRFNSPATLALGVGVLLFGLMIWAMWQQPSAQAMGAKNIHEEILNGYLFLSPNLFGFLFFFAGPLLLSFYVSFTDWDAFGSKNWIGLTNYAKIVNLDIATLEDPKQRASEILDVKVYDELTRFSLFGKHIIIGAEDKLFWLALRNTFIFSVLAVPLSIIPALFLANLLNSKLPGMKFFRAIYFLPSIAAVVGVALIWQWLYNAAVGYINYGITSMVGLINSVTDSALIDPQIRWLSDTRTALLAVVIMSAWQWIGFNTVLFLAGLQNIPGELYEAATVDGAGQWAKFWNITIPLLAPTTFFVVTTAIIQALQLFEQVYVLIPTEPPGGPNNATLSLVLYLYQKGFQRFDQGYASAVAWVLFVVIFSVTLFQFLRQRSGRGAYSV